MRLSRWNKICEYFKRMFRLFYRDFYIANKTNKYWKLIYNICYFYRLDCLVFTHLLFCKRKNRFLERKLYYFWFTNTKRRVKLNMRNVFISKLIDLFDRIQRYQLLFIQLFFLLSLKENIKLELIFVWLFFNWNKWYNFM